MMPRNLSNPATRRGKNYAWPQDMLGPGRMPGCISLLHQACLVDMAKRLPSTGSAATDPRAFS